MTNVIPVQRTVPDVNILPGIILKSPFRFLRDAALEHGDFVRLKAGPWSFYLVSNPDIFQYILRDNQRNFKKSDILYKTGSLVIGNGLVTSDGDFWLRQRRMMQPYFHKQQITGFNQVMTNAIAERVDGWLPAGYERGTINLMESIAQITIDVTAKVMFGANTLSQQEMVSLNDDQTFMIRHIALRGYTLFLPEWFPLPGAKRFQQVMARMKSQVQQIIEAGRQNQIGANTLLSMLIHAVDEETDAQMTDEQLFDEVMTIFIAGFETTARALTWLLYLLDQNPDARARVQEEIDRVVGDRTPAVEDLRHLSYTRRAFQEAMRYYPSVSLLPRTAVAGDTVAGQPVEPGTIFLMFYYGLHHNPDLWDAPETFDPDRFTEERAANRPRYAYLPFSTGARKCIGDEFAMMEGILAIAMIMQRYRLTLVPGQKVVPNLATTLTPKDEIKVMVERRA